MIVGCGRPWLGRWVGIGFLIALWLSLVEAGEVRVALVTPTGEPGVSGLTVRLLCGGKPKSDVVWNGEPLRFEMADCQDPVFEAGFYRVNPAGAYFQTLLPGPHLCLHIFYSI